MEKESDVEVVFFSACSWAKFIPQTTSLQKMIYLTNLCESLVTAVVTSMAAGTTPGISEVVGSIWLLTKLTPTNRSHKVLIQRRRIA